MQKLILSALLSALALVSGAQQKYGFLVGINKYFEHPGVPYHRVLQGCVNDAKAIKGMLIQRFGFAESGITTLFDEEASKKNVVAALQRLAAKCQPGDAVVFYFSGHGVWMENAYRLVVADSVKRGMNQAMVMSDLYAAELGCLLTDNLIKQIFNKFVDKKVVLTAIFDCCFSGNMPMSRNFFGHNIYADMPGDVTEEKSMGYDEVSMHFDEETRNGIDPDALYKELYVLENTDSLPSESGDSLRAFNLTDAIKINDPERISRPSERAGSRFLSLSGTNDVEKGLEIMDETGSFHGVFTKALLEVVKNSPSDMPVSKIAAAVNALLQKRLYSQAPKYHYDKARWEGNLVGISAKGFKNKPVVRVKSRLKSDILLDGGLYDGLAIGNLLQHASVPGVMIKVFSLSTDYTVAVPYKGKPALIKPGDSFVLADGYTQSAPLVKLYIPSIPCTADVFDEFFSKKVTPLLRDEKYRDFHNWDNEKPTANIFFKDMLAVPKKSDLQFIRQYQSQFFVFLPIPSYISDGLKSLLARDQNVQLVKTAAEAELVLYLNYAQASEDRKPGYVFTYQNLEGIAVNSPGFGFYEINKDVPNLHLGGLALLQLAKDLHQLTRETIRKRTSQWLNDYPAR